jgi:CheY-like chemotaxis protein
METIASPPTVLVVDDDPGNLLFLDAALAPLGYEVVPLRTIAAAERFLAVSQPRLVLLDVRLPGECGIEACLRWRADRSLDAVPIILITASAARDQRADGLAAGADDYLEKPVEFDTLQRVAQRWLATGRSTGEGPALGDHDSRVLASAMQRAAKRRRGPLFSTGPAR